MHGTLRIAAAVATTALAASGAFIFSAVTRTAGSQLAAVSFFVESLCVESLVAVSFAGTCARAKAGDAIRAETSAKRVAPTVCCWT
jgi:hypothetical protein